MATNTERLDQHQKDVQQILTEIVRQQAATQAVKDGTEATAARLGGIEDAMRRLQTELSDTRTAVARQDERLKALEKHADHPAALSALDQRLKALEKGTDRLWQFAPIALAALALLISLYVAFVKK